MSAPTVTHIAVAVVSHQGRYLVGQRPAGVPLEGLWEFPGGKVLSGEEPAAAACRECREETGLAVTVRDEYPAVEHQYPHGRLHLRFFACAPSDPAAMPNAPFIWVRAAELARLEFPPANQALIARLTAGA